MINHIHNELLHNLQVFEGLLRQVPEELIRWKKSEDEWNLLEIVCHLYDEERLDFRFRAEFVMNNPGQIPPPFNPVDWVKDHRYDEQDYQLKLGSFFLERQKSLDWLSGLDNPNLQLSFDHPKLGKLTAGYFLQNWVAHDYLHIRQIIKRKFDYLESVGGMNNQYAGSW